MRLALVFCIDWSVNGTSLLIAEKFIYALGLEIKRLETKLIFTQINLQIEMISSWRGGMIALTDRISDFRIGKYDQFACARKKIT